MTINELESKLQKLDPNLEIVRDDYVESEVLVIKPDLLAVKGQCFIYDFSNKRFIRNGLLEWFNNTDTFAFDKMQSLLNRYWYESKETQKISKEKDEYWYQCECVNCHKTFRTLQKDADNVIQCPFCKARPWGFTVSGTKKEHENE